MRIKFKKAQKIQLDCVPLHTKKNNMAEHNELGKEGEDEAAHYLTERGYHIRHRNWRRRRNELDIVAEKDNQLIIVEVKTRRNEAYGHPEDAITNRKIRVVGNEPPFRIEHIEEAFLPPIW